MSCPKCGSLASRMTQSFKTLAFAYSFTDENGKRHYHDPNIRKDMIECAACGHVRNETRYGSCWCGWTNAPRTAPNPKAAEAATGEKS